MATASAASIPSNAIFGTTSYVGYVIKSPQLIDQIKPNYMWTVVFSPKAKGSWDCHVDAYYNLEYFVKNGIVEFYWRSGSGKWNKFRTAEYNRNEETHVTQRLTSGDSKIQFMIRMYNPNVGDKYGIMKKHTLPTGCVFIKAK